MGSTGWTARGCAVATVDGANMRLPRDEVRSTIAMEGGGWIGLSRSAAADVSAAIEADRVSGAADGGGGGSMALVTERLRVWKAAGTAMCSDTFVSARVS